MKIKNVNQNLQKISKFYKNSPDLIELLGKKEKLSKSLNILKTLPFVIIF